MRPAGSGTITISDGIASCPITLRGNALIAEALACLARREGLFEVYRGTLDSFEFEGLWQRLRYDRTSSILGSAATWIAITLAGLLLRRLPADISLQIFMQGGEHQRRR